MTALTGSISTNTSTHLVGEMSDITSTQANKMPQTTTVSTTHRSGLNQISQQIDDPTKRDLGKLNTPLPLPFTQHSLGTFTSATLSIPGNILEGIGHFLWHQGPYGEGSAADDYRCHPTAPFEQPPSPNTISEHIGQALKTTGIYLNAIAGSIAGVIGLGETLLARAVHFCMGQDVSKTNRMGQISFPNDHHKISNAISDLKLLLYTMNNENQSGKDMWGKVDAPVTHKYTPFSEQKLPEGYRIATLNELPQRLRPLYNYDSGIIHTNTPVPVGVGIFIDENTNTLKLAFRGINDDPATQKGAVTGSLYTDSFMKTALDIVQKMSSYNKDMKLELIGHSLGGEAVEYAGAMTGLKTTAYNSAGLCALSRAEIGKDKINAANITNINTSTDWLSQDLVRSSWVPRAQIGMTQYQFEADTRRTNENPHFVEAMIDGLAHNVAK